MPSFPVPVFAAAILACLLLRLFWSGEGSRWLRLLIAVTAVQSLIAAAVQHYGIMELRVLQPFTASLIPPLTWLAFLHGALRPVEPRDVRAQLAAPAFVLFCIVFAPLTLDVVLPALFTGYGLLMLYAMRNGADRLPLARLESSAPSLRSWRLLAILLIGSAASDVLIVADILFWSGDLKGSITSVTSSLLLMGVGLMGLERAQDEPDAPASGEEPPLEAVEAPDDTHLSEEERQLVGRAFDLLTTSRLAADPDLTLARLARRLMVPAKTLSAAINRVEQMNVSQFVNRYRVELACRALTAGTSVTEAMFEAGFRTKSNFNREFRRVTGQSPTGWQRANAGRAQACASSQPIT